MRSVFWILLLFLPYSIRSGWKTLLLFCCAVSFTLNPLLFCAVDRSTRRAIALFSFVLFLLLLQPVAFALLSKRERESPAAHVFCVRTCCSGEHSPRVEQFVAPSLSPWLPSSLLSEWEKYSFSLSGINGLFMSFFLPFVFAKRPICKFVFLLHFSTVIFPCINQSALLKIVSLNDVGLFVAW